MDRRRFIASLTGIAANASIPAAVWQAGIATAESDTNHDAGDHSKLALPTADQTKWQDMEMGMFVHFAPNTWQGVEQDNLSTPLSEINPKLLSTDQWASTAVDLGAKYIVFVAKHSGGFCMWQTETTKYSIGNTPWRGGHGDVLRDVSASCRKFGLKLGVYVSPRDAKHGAEIGGLCKTPAQQKIYNAIYRRQLTEVLSRYGSMVEIWFDGSIVIPVGDILARYAPHAMIFQGPHATIRWAGNEEGFVPYPAWNSISFADAKTGVATALNGDPNGSVWMPNEVDVSILRPDWFWSPTSQRNLLTLDAMMEIYYRSIGRGAQLLLNLPPDTTGLMPTADVTRAQQFGKEIQRRFGKSVAETSGSGENVTLSLPAGSRVDTFLMQEDCSFGERVRQYKIEARQAGKWVTLGTGSAIGHKRIQPIPSTIADAVRLVAVESAARPVIRRLAVYDTQTPPPKNWDAPATAWAYDGVGTWSDYSFRIDVTDKMVAATQYRLRFVPQAGWGDCPDPSTDPIEHVTVQIGGVAEPKLLRPLRGSRDVLILTMPGIGQKVILQGRLKCAASGTILLRKL
ncbi:MAG TPA: alpha-L-fucosidase [Acidobacteriaceae bacterium]|nr:alpha-L-fucosidase [Acidobacteriaceae bacterium]